MPQIKLTQLLADPRNPNVCEPETLAKLKANIEHLGHYQPLIVRVHPQDPTYYILIDGHQRKLVFESLGWESAECQIWTLTDEQAQLALATLNQLRGTDVPKKRAELLSSLMQVMPVDDLVGLIPESQGQIQDLLNLVNQDLIAVEQALKAEIQREQANLPFALTFLLEPDAHQIWEQAQDRFSDNEKDRGTVLIKICLKALEASNVQA